jgi:hypothetical protein
MQTYLNELTDAEREAVEFALDIFRDACAELTIKLAGDDRAGNAAEALAVYLHASRSESGE